MLLSYKTVLQKALHDACVAAGGDITVLLEKPRDAAHGDYACPAAMQLARLCQRAPRALAEDIVQHFTPPDFVASVNIAGGGFINIQLRNSAKTAIIPHILQQGKNYGRGTPKDETILLEFVSANPTGPLHVGHGRAAAFGDSLGNILSFSGWHVWREYYVNDTGRQAAILAASVWLRYWLSQTQEDFAMPAGTYRGDYLQLIVDHLTPRLAAQKAPHLAITMAKLSADDDTNADILMATMQEFFTTEDLDSFIAAVVDAVLTQNIQRDLALLGVSFDCWFSEKSLHREGKIISAIDSLRAQSPDSLYDKDGALWFRATAFGDDKDRVVRRANGQFTYFAADVAYHYDKFTARTSRQIPPKNHLRLINVLGADHHGYVPRLTAALQALGHRQLEVRLIQFVSLIENGKRLKMSTRAGDFISLKDLIDQVGCDAARYFYISRKNDQPLDFDLNLAQEKSRKNPLIYAQYAHARVCTLLTKWQEEQGGKLAQLRDADNQILADDEAAVALCGVLLDFPEVVARAASDCVVHPLAVYANDLATAIHNFYEQTHILSSGDDGLRRSRLALLAAARQTLGVALNLLGVQAPEHM